MSWSAVVGCCSWTGHLSSFILRFFEWRLVVSFAKLMQNVDRFHGNLCRKKKEKERKKEDETVYWKAELRFYSF